MTAARTQGGQLRGELAVSSSPCGLCAADGPACGTLVAPSGEPPAPCIRCRALTLARSVCGVARHYHCPMVTPGKGLTGAAPVSPVVCMTCGERFATVEESTRHPHMAAPAPAQEPRWLAREESSRRVVSEQPALRDELAARGVPAEAVGRAVRLWNEHMRGIGYAGGHRTALGILTGAYKHRSVPDLPTAHPDELAAPGDGPVWSARAWPVYPGSRPAATEWADRASSLGDMALAGYDVNGMYLSAAAIELGTGAPVRQEWPKDETAVLKRPGWVRVAALEGAPWSIADRWQEGMWLPTPLVAYLRDAGAQLLIPEAVTQPEHRRWLDPHVDLMRGARAALIDQDTPEAIALLAVVKDVYTRMFGGLLESREHNRSATMRPWWKAQIVATAQARMFRGLDRVAATGTTAAPVVGVHVDAAWFVLPAGWEVPPGLQLSTQLGKWKPAGRARWSPELAAAYAAGETRPLWAALNPKAAEAAR